MKYNNHDKIRDFIIIEAYMFRFKKKVKPEVDMTIKEFILLTYFISKKTHFHLRRLFQIYVINNRI